MRISDFGPFDFGFRPLQGDNYHLYKRRSERAQSKIVNLVRPIRHEHIGIASAAVVAVGAENQLFAVGREHGEGVEDTLRGDFFQSGAVFVDHVQLEVVAPCGVVVAGEDDFFPGWMEKRCPVGFAEFGDLAQVGAVRVAGVNFHADRGHQTLFEEVFVLFNFRFGGGAAGAEHDFGAIGAKKRAAVITEFVGNLFGVAAVEVHGPKFQVAAAVAGEQNFVAFGADHCFGVVADGVGEAFFQAPFSIGHINVVGIVDGPQVFAALAQIGCGRTGVVAFVGAGEKHVFAIWHKKGASGAAMPRADHWGPIGGVIGGFIHVHHKNLVALQPPFFVIALEHQFFAVGAPISFRIVAAESEFADVAQVVFRSGGGRFGVAVVLCGTDQGQKQRRDGYKHIVHVVHIVFYCCKHIVHVVHIVFYWG